MNLLGNTLFPPYHAPKFDFADCDQFDESDYQDSVSFGVGTHYFKPQWKKITPTQFQNQNCFCPYCGQYVTKNTQNLFCKIQGTQKSYLGHKMCIEDQKNQQIQFSFTNSPYTIQKGYLDLNKFNSNLGVKQFVMSLKIEHPLSDLKYFRMDKKSILNDGQIEFNLENYNRSDNFYELNIIVVPLPQVNIKLNLRQIGSQVETQNINMNIDLSQIFVGLQITQKQSVWVVNNSSSSSWITKIQISLVFDNELKKQLIEKMNFKYKYGIIKNLPLLKLNKILIRSKNYQNEINKSNIENTKASSTYGDGFLQGSQNNGYSNQNILSIRINEPTLKMSDSSRKTYQEIAKSKFNALKQQIDIRKTSKTQNGSKQIQKKIKQMKSEQISYFIQEISAYIYELLQDDYANYMIQTLIKVSNANQRLRIFEALKDKITKIIYLKQGTFAFQQMIAFINTHQQYELFSQIMAQNFFQVATNINGNHFLRKLIPFLSFQYNEKMIRKMFQNFLELANNKNSVCVLKVILRSIANQRHQQKVKQVKRKIIDCLTLNTQKIIKNEFGNYLIQQAFQLFGQHQLKGISQFIFNKFKPLSKEKFSSSVICRCISIYWRSSQYYDRIKSRLSLNDILQLFRNREGNKVLLELMSSEIDFSFKNKILSAISNDMPSKYNSSKWANSTGSKTGRSGENNYLSFSQSTKAYQSKRIQQTPKMCESLKYYEQNSNLMIKKKTYNTYNIN